MQGHKVLKKLISFILFMSILITMSSAVIATDKLNDETAVVLSDEEPLGSSELLMGEHFAKLLDGLNALAELPGASYGIDYFLGEIFGSETEEIKNILSEINQNLVNVQTEIQKLNQKLDDDNLKSQLQKYNDMIISYKRCYDTIIDRIESSDSSDKSLEEKAKNNKEFLLEVFHDKNELLRVNGNKLLIAVNDLGESLLNVDTKTGKNCFEAMDALALRTFKWEHQGYPYRKALRENAIAIYTLLAAICDMAYTEAIEEAKAAGQSYSLIQSSQKVLQKNIVAVRDMVEKTAVVEREPYVRYYQVPGHEILLSTEARARTINPNAPKGSESWEYVDDLRLNFNENHFASMLGDRRVSGGFINNTTNIPDSKLMQIYKDYGGKKTLYEIFFSEEEGNFINVDNLPENTRFATSTFWFTYKGGSVKTYKAAYAHVVSNDGKLDNDVRLAYVMKLADGWYYVTIKEQFIGIAVPHWEMPGGDETNTKPEVSVSGMEPSYELPYDGTITLSVEPKDNQTYSWQVNKGNGFEEIIDDEDKDNPKPANESSYIIKSIDYSMNGYEYRCIITDYDGDEIINSVTTDAVTLNFEKHDIDNADQLKSALDLVEDGSWNKHILRLKADITYNHPITLIDRGITIDLNGHTLTIQPNSSAKPNVANPAIGKQKLAAVNADNNGFLNLTGEGKLNVIAGDGIDFGVFTGKGSNVRVNAVTSESGGSAVYALDGGKVTGDSISANGEEAYGIECFGGSTVTVSGDVTTTGGSSCGVYVDGWNGEAAKVSIGGDIAVSGKNSQGALLGGETAELTVNGSVMVTGGIAGISTGKGSVFVEGNVSAPCDSINAYDNAFITVKGNVVSTDDDSTAVHSNGAEVYIYGNVTSSGKKGTAINASAWDLVDPVIGSRITVGGKITAFIPLRIESLPVEISEHTEITTKVGYYTFTDGTNYVWAKPDSFVKKDDTDVDNNPIPQTGDFTSTVQLLVFGIGALAIFIMQAKAAKKQLVLRGNK